MSTLYPRYSGRFYGLMPFYRNGDRYTSAERLWEVTIYQMADAPFAVADLVFAADSPLSIEWGDTDPTEVVEGSTATLRLISPGDRTFADLYTVAPLGVVVEVKASGTVVWRGSMEPELYEEPYSTPDGYVVELSSRSDCTCASRAAECGYWHSLASESDHALWPCLSGCNLHPDTNRHPVTLNRNKTIFACSTLLFLTKK